VLRDRHVHRDRAGGDLPQADRLVPRVRGRVDRADRATAEALAVVLLPLRRSCDRARDKARVPGAVRADGARRAGQQPGGAARVRARAGDVATTSVTVRSSSGCASSRSRF
jgi:hypothetical protein